MKLDIVRAWKDETYRQSLSEEQMNTLPANPAGELELADSSLRSVLGAGGAGPGVAPVAAVAPVPVPVHGGCCGGSNVGLVGQESFHSLAFQCNEAVFSFTSVSGFSFLSPVTPICINDQD